MRSHRHWVRMRSKVLESTRSSPESVSSDSGLQFPTLGLSWGAKVEDSLDGSRINARDSMWFSRTLFATPTSSPQDTSTSYL
jgi:hypothetical protein